MFHFRHRPRQRTGPAATSPAELCQSSGLAEGVKSHKALFEGDWRLFYDLLCRFAGSSRTEPERVCGSLKKYASHFVDRALVGQLNDLGLKPAKENPRKKIIN